DAGSARHVITSPIRRGFLRMDRIVSEVMIRDLSVGFSGRRPHRRRSRSDERPTGLCKRVLELRWLLVAVLCSDSPDPHQRELRPDILVQIIVVIEQSL